MTSVADRELEAESRRIGRMLSRFLVPLLKPNMEILSVGCGMGSDVLELRRRGFQAWGLDPSRLHFDHIPSDAVDYFRIGAVEDKPFGDKTFDFVYALDVIEHVGCLDFKSTLTSDTMAIRHRFLASCMDALKPGGKLLLTTSNKLCPIDVGHWHKYHWIGRVFDGRRKFGISVPWSPKNFLPSFRDLKNMLTTVCGPGNFDLVYVPTASYPSVSERRGPVARLATGMLRIVDMPLLIGSPLAPILIVAITKRIAGVRST